MIVIIEIEIGAEEEVMIEEKVIEETIEEKVIEVMIEETIEGMEIEEIVTEDADEIINSYSSIESMQTGLKAILEFASNKRKAILHIFNSVNRDIFEQDLWKVCEYAVVQYLRPKLTFAGLSELDQEIAIKFYKCECFGFAIDWLNNGMEDEAEVMIDRFCEFHQKIFEQLLIN